jgi:HK97 gp10 family phage protein
MAQFVITIRNADQVVARLNKLGDDARKVISRALRDGAKVIQQSASGLVNTGPGRTAPGTHLKDQIKVRSGRVRDNSQVRLLVTTGDTTGSTTDESAMYRGKYFYGAFVEFGHALGRRGTPNRKMVKPYPFLGPAFTANEAAVVAMVESSLEAGLTARGV